MLSFKRDPAERPLGSDALSSGERFALVHSSIPFALIYGK
ncbi:hypothetical protein LEP1GSC059_4207 [Leptospira noguchii serovar Panama str. CZ214]|uniref:Uncharacterized protein n=1 Tax=Leptospira noguchii serovar Panama str. CZ214 TaxID=1001595 RepID=T0FAM0_9LEPT|nr:hypothetical protein LEP1GSC059_4207 [Leptospira noguchii serovar Panama str. CZ214]